VIVSRRPGNVIGWLCCAIGLCLSLSVFGSNDAQTTLAADPDRAPAGLLLMILGELGFVLSLGLLFTFVLLLFPSGRLLSRRWRPVAWTAGAALAAIAAGTVFQPGPMGPGLPANPVGITATGEALGRLQGAAGGVIAVLVPACLASLVVRFRRAKGAERQQLKWFGPAGSSWSLGSWLEDAGVPARVIDELMGHRAARAGGTEAPGSAIGTVYRHLTPEMQARVLAAVDECLSVALGALAAPMRPPAGRRSLSR
jgi:hypothetical protein